MSRDGLTRTPLKLMTVVGARPQFVKAAVVSRAIATLNENSAATAIEEVIIHTGQHYDDRMSRVFFAELGIPPPKLNLDVGSGGHSEQTGRMLEALEPVMRREKPDWLLVYGDTNSTLAGALAAAKLGIPIAHVEAGLRSFNRHMPEEINRIVTDHLSTMLLPPTATATLNLAAEGINENVHQVGDVMYDSVRLHASHAEARSDVLERLELEPGAYYLATVHRAENTDDADRLARLVEALEQLDRPVVLPLHPRTRRTLGSFNGAGNLRLTDALPYLDMLKLARHARIVLTDSGGVQKEAYWLDRPCVTLRDETEWVELVETGCNRLAGADVDRILRAVADFEAAGARLPEDRPATLFGDGNCGARVVELLVQAPRSRSSP
jgi:UDP-N-acetylglucosamine 2-epimerase